MIDWLEANGHGEATTTYRLRDWLFSRQRYWGEPFPIVFDETGLPVGLPESMLPVTLPPLDDFRPRTLDPDDAASEPELPLSRVDWWATIELDLGDGPKRYQRELNVMPQWAGSCWYELRYLDPTNENRFVDPEVERYWMGPQARGRPGRRRPVRGRRRARRAPPAVRPLLAQGPVRPGPRLVVGAVPPPVQPGLHPGRGLTRTTGRSTSTPTPSVEEDPTARSPTRAGPSSASGGRWARA